MVRLVVAVTDWDWFSFLRAQPSLAEVNFWQPGGRSSFKAIQPGELFLFKLHSPRDYIAGGGLFAHASNVPLSLAWDAFGTANGATSLEQMRTRIAHYRREPLDLKADPVIGCRILVQPFFADEGRWLPVPPSWSPTIVSLTHQECMRRDCLDHLPTQGSEVSRFHSSPRRLVAVGVKFLKN